MIPHYKKIKEHILNENRKIHQMTRKISEEKVPNWATETEILSEGKKNFTSILLLDYLDNLSAIPIQKEGQ